MICRRCFAPNDRECDCARLAMAAHLDEFIEQHGIPPTEAQLDMLEAIVGMTADKGLPPTLSELGEEYGMTKQAAARRIDALRRKGLLEPPRFHGAPRDFTPSHNGKLALETRLGAELK